MKLLLSLAVCAPALASSLYDIVVKDLSGNEISLSEFKGKVVLIVNTASKCGFTGQYKELEELYQEFKDKGFVVLAFPSNDFLGQEPGSNKEIKEFCKTRFNITFPIFSKSPVTGKDKQPTFVWLTNQAGGGILWNFEKFLIGKEGEFLGRWRSTTTPSKLKKEIRKALEKG